MMSTELDEYKDFLSIADEVSKRKCFSHFICLDVLISMSRPVNTFDMSVRLCISVCHYIFLSLRVFDSY